MCPDNEFTIPAQVCAGDKDLLFTFSAFKNQEEPADSPFAKKKEEACFKMSVPHSISVHFVFVFSVPSVAPRADI